MNSLLFCLPFISQGCCDALVQASGEEAGQVAVTCGISVLEPFEMQLVCSLPARSSSLILPDAEVPLVTHLALLFLVSLALITMTLDTLRTDSK